MSSGSSINLEGVREKQQTNMAQTMIGSPHANVPSQKASGSIQILKKFEKSKFEKLEKFKMNSKEATK